MTTLSKERRKQHAATVADQRQREEYLRRTVSIVARVAVPVLAVLIVGLLVLGVVSHQRGQRGERVAAGYRVLREALAVDLMTSMGDNLDRTAVEKRRGLLERVVRDYADTPAAIDAAAYLPSLDFTAGNYDAAARGFAAFVQKHPDQEPLSSLARLGEANSALAMGQCKEALAKFKAFAGTTAPAAAPWIERARLQAGLCAAILGQTADAQKLLGELLTATTDAAVRRTAEDLLQQLKVATPEQLRWFNPTLDPAPGTDKPAAKVEDKPAAKVEDKPAAKVEDKPAAKAAEPPAAKVEDRPAAKVEDKPAEPPAAKAAEPAAAK